MVGGVSFIVIVLGFRLLVIWGFFVRVIFYGVGLVAFLCLSCNCGFYLYVLVFFCFNLILIDFIRGFLGIIRLLSGFVSDCVRINGSVLVKFYIIVGFCRVG